MVLMSHATAERHADLHINPATRSNTCIKQPIDPVSDKVFRWGARQTCLCRESAGPATIEKTEKEPLSLHQTIRLFGRRGCSLAARYAASSTMFLMFYSRPALERLHGKKKRHV
jgi:hypothetical protein